MKRHPALVSYSSDHHHGLVWARKLADITETTPPDTKADVASEFLDVWGAEIAPHFTTEEEILLPLYAIHGEINHPSIRQMLAQHIALRRDILLIRETPTTTLLRQIGEQLRAHIRHEEQEVFPLIEDKTPEEILQKIKRLSD